MNPQFMPTNKQTTTKQTNTHAHTHIVANNNINSRDHDDAPWLVSFIPFIFWLFVVTASVDFTTPSIIGFDFKVDRIE
jgi:hypothetical protein